MGKTVKYRLILDRRFLKEMKVIPESDRLRIRRKLQEFADNGDDYRHQRLKDPRFKRICRLRVGVWRIFYDALPQELVIAVYAVKHRREAYR